MELDNIPERLIFRDKMIYPSLIELEKSGHLIEKYIDEITKGDFSIFIDSKKMDLQSWLDELNHCPVFYVT